MNSSPVEFTLELTPTSRLDLIDVRERLQQPQREELAGFSKALYCSYHTTAGYLEQSLCARLNYDREAIQAFVRSFQHLFPQEARYRHDQMELRDELTEAQKEVEPLNADSHLIYMGSGLEPCVTYVHQPDRPVYFIDLDGVYNETPRRRQTTVVGYNEELPVVTEEIQIPVSNHPIDSVNLRDATLGIFEPLHELLEKHGVGKGRVELALAPHEQFAALTVNEYETLLMQHDLAEVLGNPLRFMAQKGRNMLRDPRAIRNKVKNYAKYDLVRFVNEVIDVLGLNESLVERIIDKFIAVEASRRLRMKRSVSMLVNNTDERGLGHIIQGTYQSPILVQWRRNVQQTRTLRVTMTKFE